MKVVRGGLLNPLSRRMISPAIRMSRQTAQTFYVCVDRHHFTVDPDQLLTILQSAPASSASLVSDQKHCAGRVRKPLGEMMKHPPAGCHS